VYYTPLVQQIPGFVVTADAMKEALTAEIVEMTDRVTVLRDGGVVGAGVPTREVDEASLTRTMLGRHLVVQSRVGTHARDEVVASARGMSVGTVTGLDVAAPPAPATVAADRHPGPRLRRALHGRRRLAGHDRDLHRRRAEPLLPRTDLLDHLQLAATAGLPHDGPAVHHLRRNPCYLSWQEYLSIEASLAANNTQKRARPVREGTALCEGIISCGVCGGRVGTRCDRKVSYTCQIKDSARTAQCRTVSASTVDDAVGTLFLNTITPQQIGLRWPSPTKSPSGRPAPTVRPSWRCNGPATTRTARSGPLATSTRRTVWWRGHWRPDSPRWLRPRRRW
jgi:hypothetical protein